MAAGRPVLTNACGDVADLIEREGIGRVVDADADIMARALLAMLAEPLLLEAQGERARQAAEERYSWDQLARRVELFCQKVIGLG
jgi:glycosyltransferase involved in cell wall biosynthesis